MMTLNTRLKAESSKIISSLLLSVLEACREGDVDLADGLGLSIETLRQLDRLKADQILNISGHYMRGLDPLAVFQIDSEKISRSIELAVEETKQYEMIDEFLLRGACKTMMGALFGMRSTQVANRKKLLDLPTVRGRLGVSTLEEQQQIYKAWLVSIKIPDYRGRLLYVGRATNLLMSKIFREVQEVEKIRNASSLTRTSTACITGVFHD